LEKVPKDFFDTLGFGRMTGAFLLRKNRRKDPAVIFSEDRLVIRVYIQIRYYMMQMYGQGVSCAYSVPLFQKLHKKSMVSKSVLGKEVFGRKFAPVKFYGLLNGLVYYGEKTLE